MMFDQLQRLRIGFPAQRQGVVLVSQLLLLVFTQTVEVVDGDAFEQTDRLVQDIVELLRLEDLEIVTN